MHRKGGQMKAMRFRRLKLIAGAVVILIAAVYFVVEHIEPRIRRRRIEGLIARYSAAPDKATADRLGKLGTVTLFIPRVTGRMSGV